MTIAGTVQDQPELIPARMLNEFTYCPRLGYLMWVDGEFAENEFVADGRRVHRRVDEAADPLPDPAADPEAPQTARSVMLSGPRCGLVARLDLLETEGRMATPVDYKRGPVPGVEGGVREPEQVQLAAQAMLLLENGFACERGVIWYAGSRRRVEIPFTETLFARTAELIRQFREAARSPAAPPPLAGSPKCEGCSLAGICLPDETLLLSGAGDEVEPRRRLPARGDALPVYVREQGAYVHKSGEELQITKSGQTLARAKLFETSQLCLFGNVQISAQTLAELVDREIPVCWFSFGGWFRGMFSGPGHRNVQLRILQFHAADSAKRSLLIARGLVANKICNCRTLLRRNAREAEPEILPQLKKLATAARGATSPAGLLGIEGTAARVYFGAFPAMIRDKGLLAGFTFEGRNRRPPADPVNALLSYAYTLLVKDCTVTLQASGFDPLRGFYHQPRYGRPSLALDLMEPFRPLLADSVVLTAINTGLAGSTGFTRAGGGVCMKEALRKAFINLYERRLNTLIRHPLFGYTISYRRVLEVQARLLGRYLQGGIPRLPPFLTR